MPASTRPGRLIIVCGPPGAGKTTVAMQLECSHGAIRMCPDEWMIALGIDLFDGPARARIEALQWGLTRKLLARGSTVAIEWGTWGRHERDGLRSQARELGVAVELRVVDAPTEVLWQRIVARGLEARHGSRPYRRADLDDAVRHFDRPTAGELRLYDSPR